LIFGRPVVQTFVRCVAKFGSGVVDDFAGIGIVHFPVSMLLNMVEMR
jgi:hypothetical protein